MNIQSMNYMTRRAFCTGAAALCLLAAGPSQADDVSLEELRSILIRAAELSARMRTTVAPPTDALHMAPPEVLEVMRDAVGDPLKLANAMDRLEAANETSWSLCSRLPA